MFQSFKDESITGKYENDYGASSVAFIDQNTLKYQEMIKKMEKKGKGSGSGSGSEDDDDNNECNEQSVVITMNIKHFGKGVVSQSYDISDSEEEEEEEEQGETEEEEKGEKHVNEYKNTQMQSQSHTHNHHKKNEYIHEKTIDIDDI